MESRYSKIQFTHTHTHERTTWLQQTMNYLNYLMFHKTFRNRTKKSYKNVARVLFKTKVSVITEFIKEFVNFFFFLNINNRTCIKIANFSVVYSDAKWITWIMTRLQHGVRYPDRKKYILKVCMHSTFNQPVE